MRLGRTLEKSVSKGENVIRICYRHPAGLLPIYLFTLISIGISAIVVRTLSNNEDLSFLDLSTAVWGTILIILVIVIISSTIIARQIYWANELILTDENVIQILRRSLFSQDVAQLNLGKIQDVSVKQRGFWQFGLKYGTIIIETAGEVASYKFTYAPQPNQLAAQIIKAHDDYLEKYGLQKETRQGSP